MPSKCSYFHSPSTILIEWRVSERERQTEIMEKKEGQIYREKGTVRTEKRKEQREGVRKEKRKRERDRYRERRSEKGEREGARKEGRER